MRKVLEKLDFSVGVCRAEAGGAEKILIISHRRTQTIRQTKRVYFWLSDPFRSKGQARDSQKRLPLCERMQISSPVRASTLPPDQVGQGEMSV